MEANPISKVTSLPPKQLALIAVGGIGLGFLWRRVSGSRNAATATATPVDVAPTPDINSLPLESSSTGNLGAMGGSSGSNNGGSTDGSSITLPVVGWVINIGGTDYWTDGTNVKPLKDPPAPANPLAPTFSHPHAIKPGETLDSLVKAFYPSATAANRQQFKDAIATRNNLKWNAAKTAVTPWKVGQVVYI